MKKKLIPWIVSGSLVVVLLAGGVWYFKAKGASAAPAGNYITGQVKFGNVKKTINATGTVQVPTEYSLSFSGTGKVTEIDVKLGDVVKAGQVLAKQDQTDAQQQVSQAQDNLAQAELKLSQAQGSGAQVNVLQAQNGVTKAQSNAASALSSLQTLKSYTNSTTLQATINQATVPQKATLQGYKDNSANLTAAINQAANNYSSAEGDLALAKAQLAQTSASNSADVKSAQIQVSQAKTALATAQSTLDKTVITAPVDGTVSAINGQVGESPASGGTSSSGNSSTGSGSGGSSSSSGSGFITLAGKSTTMQIEVPVDEADISSVQVGQSADITLDAYSDKNFSGTVTTVSPTGSTSSGVTTFSVTITLTNTNNLMKAGMSANVSIIVDQKQNVLVVPSMAVNDNGSEQTVTVLSTDSSAQPERRQVKIGIDDGNNAQVLSGLQAGDQVVIGTRARTSSASSQKSNSMMGGLSGFGGGLSGAGFPGGSGFSGNRNGRSNGN